MQFRKYALSLLAAIVLFASAGAVEAATTLLPNGKQCFSNADGVLAGGSITMYVPNTTSFKDTWQDSSQSVLNTNPIDLDANGCAIIYGVGIYRQIVKDSLLNTIWDQITTDTSAFNDVFWSGNSAGTPNVITITDTGFNATDGTVIQFVATNTNTGATTINPSGYGAITVQKDTTTGPISLSGGEIVNGNIISVVYDATGNSFHLLNLISAATTSPPTPLCGAIGLTITNDATTPNSKVTITADQVVMLTTSGQYVSRSDVSATVNFTVTGANGLDTGSSAASKWYNIYFIDNGIVAAGLGSLSTTAPTMPAGYSYQCRLGAMQTDSSGNFKRTLQNGNIGQYKITAGSNTLLLPSLGVGVAGTFSLTSPTLTTVTPRGTTTQCVPSTAIAIELSATGVANGNDNAVLVAPNTAWGGTNNGPEGSNLVVWPIYLGLAGAASMGGQSTWINLEADTVAWASSGSGGGLSCMAWKDKVNAN